MSSVAPAPSESLTPQTARHPQWLQSPQQSRRGPGVLSATDGAEVAEGAGATEGARDYKDADAFESPMATEGARAAESA